MAATITPAPSIEEAATITPASSIEETATITPAPSVEEAAAIAAAIARFQRDTAPRQPQSPPVQNPWKRTALEEGVDRSPFG